MKSDVEVEKEEEKELKTDYSKYGKVFSRKFIDDFLRECFSTPFLF